MLERERHFSGGAVQAQLSAAGNIRSTIGMHPASLDDFCIARSLTVLNSDAGSTRGDLPLTSAAPIMHNSSCGDETNYISTSNFWQLDANPKYGTETLAIGV